MNKRLSQCTSDYGSEISNEAVNLANKQESQIESNKIIPERRKSVTFHQTLRVGIAPAYDRTVKVFTQINIITSSA